MKLACVAVLAAVQVAFAEPKPGLQDPANPITPEPPPPAAAPDPVVASSAQHGIESTSRHRGLGLTLALGGGIVVGVGIDSSVGRGPSGSGRLSHMAGERWAFNFEVANITLLHQIKATDGTKGSTRTDLGNNVLVGAQLYVNRSLWIRGGGGLGSFQVDNPDSMEDKILPGVTGVLGGGFDIVRFRRAAIGVEMMSLGMLNRDGLLTVTSFMLDLSIE